MIGQIAVRVTADRANFPLGTLFVRAGSAANVAIIGVPVRVGVIVEAITLRVENVDGVTTDFAARALGGVWVVDIPSAHLATVGSVVGGVCVFASGKGADDETVRTWNIGVGNLEVLTADAEAPAPTPGATFWPVRLHATAPTTPRRADAYIDNGMLKIYNGTAWVSIGGSSVDVDSTLTQQGSAADAKAVGNALAGKLDGAAAYPAWLSDDYEPPVIVSHKGRLWRCLNHTNAEPGEEGSQSDWQEVTIEDLKQDKLSVTQLDNINEVPSKADKFANATAGNLAAFDAQGNLADSGVKPSDFATPSDLPYRLVEPGKWEFSGISLADYDVSAPVYDVISGNWEIRYVSRASGIEYANEVAGQANDLSFVFDGPDGMITATRPSLPGHLIDRAGNRVVVTGDIELTLPAAVPGYLRDFLVRLEIIGSTVPTITFAAPTGETITYETDGDEFPVPDTEGTWLYSFTETVTHTFAVSLKKVNEVAAPQAQGGV